MPKKQALPPRASDSTDHSALTPGSGDKRRLQTRRSGVHGKGVFALQDLAEGEMLLEYAGEVITWPEALRRHPHDPANPNHTFYFHIDEKHVIDGKHGGNSSRWINHSCDPNCEAEDDEGRIFIKALRNIPAGQELFFDYGLIIDAPHTKKLLADYPCWCGAPNCRGTLLAPREKKARKKPAAVTAKSKPKSQAKPQAATKDAGAKASKGSASARRGKPGASTRPGKPAKA